MTETLTAAPLEGDRAVTEGDSGEVIGIVVPVLDERESLAELVGRIRRAVEDNDLALEEILFVDDGSSDGSWEEINGLAAADPSVRGVRLRRNFGKATALNVGFGLVRGDIVVTMDADLQDDPAELPKFIEKLRAGYDLVSGWKQERRDPLSKTLPSLLFNFVTMRVSGVRLHDFNCGFKAYRRSIFDNIELYGELHRYIPALAHALGYRVGEVPVRHHARKHGRSKYGVSRYLRGFLDLLTVVMITRYAWRPGHLFGGIGTLLLVLGGGILTYLTGVKLFTGASIGTRPLLLLGATLLIIGIQVLSFGMLSELLLSRTSGLKRADLVRAMTPPADEGE